MTLALPVFAGAVFDAQRVAHALIAARAGPALLTAARSAHTDAVGPAVDRAHLCGRTEHSGSGAERFCHGHLDESSPVFCLGKKSKPRQSEKVTFVFVTTSQSLVATMNRESVKNIYKICDNSHRLKQTKQKSHIKV